MKYPRFTRIVLRGFFLAFLLCTSNAAGNAQTTEDEFWRKLVDAKDLYRAGLRANQEANWEEAEHYFQSALRNLAPAQILEYSPGTPEKVGLKSLLDSIAVAYRITLAAAGRTDDAFFFFISNYSGSSQDQQILLVNATPLSKPPIDQPSVSQEEHLSPSKKATTSGKKSTENGFNGYEWGTSAAEMRGLWSDKYDRSEGEAHCSLLVEYHGQIEYIHSVKVLMSTLSYYDDRFFGASIHFSEDASKLCELLTKTFGPPTSVRPISKTINFTDVQQYLQMSWTAYEWDREKTMRRLRLGGQTRSRKYGGPWTEWTRSGGDIYDVLSVGYQILSDSCTEAAEKMKELKAAKEKEKKSADF